MSDTLTDRERELVEAFKVFEQFLLELGHAREAGASWFTKGEEGRAAHIAMWFRKAQDAAKKAREALSTEEE